MQLIEPAAWCADDAIPGTVARFNAHSLGDGGTGLVQSVFRSPARPPPWVPQGKPRAPRRQVKNALDYHVLIRDFLNGKRAIG